MSAASNYLENMTVNALLRGAAFTSPTKTYISLHTADPGETGANEITTTDWPSYARQDAAKGGTQASAWTAAADGVSKNALQLTFPVFDGATSKTITHYCVWDAATGGNLLTYSALTTSRVVNIDDVFVVNPNKLTVQVL